MSPMPSPGDEVVCISNAEIERWVSMGKAYHVMKIVPRSDVPGNGPCVHCGGVHDFLALEGFGNRQGFCPRRFVPKSKSELVNLIRTAPLDGNPDDERDRKVTPKRKVKA